LAVALPAALISLPSPAAFKPVKTKLMRGGDKPQSLLHFRLDGRYMRFTADVGIDKGAGTSGSVEFEVTNKAPTMPAKRLAAPLTP